MGSRPPFEGRKKAGLPVQFVRLTRDKTGIVGLLRYEAPPHFGQQFKQDTDTVITCHRRSDKSGTMAVVQQCLEAGITRASL